MNRIKKISVFAAIFFTPILPASAVELPNVEQLFKQKCSFCHAVDKQTLGPAINTMSSDAKILRQAIIKGKNAMPGYDKKLTSAEVEAIVNYLLENRRTTLK